ncbi:HAD family hydrolase [Catelliglobosispora koreensis]|uniref:HAD family hydrolase n=1 Tax=Catelliglobosispora koreensis TaxID=129052 RepID=UPI0003680159|nr:HAD hydrolase-like protein [Catelliglobosispora koreensis]
MHLVWDWNGTLLDDFHIVVESTNAAFVHAGGQPISADRHRRNFRRPIIDFYSDELGRRLDEPEFVRLNDVFHNHYRAAMISCALAADAHDAMASWNGTQSLLSMWYHDELIAAVGRFGLSFARVDGSREFREHKAEALAEHLDELKIKGEDAVLIGDSIDDAHAAEAAGARCVLYAGGFTDPDVLRGHGAPVADTLTAAVLLALR